jgi:hypothetical protein
MMITMRREIGPVAFDKFIRQGLRKQGRSRHSIRRTVRRLRTTLIRIEKWLIAEEWEGILPRTISLQ